MSETDPRVRFGHLVSRRRKQLGLTLDRLQAAGGPSDVTTSRIERALEPNPRTTTLLRLDTGLRWVEGSAARALAGGDPTPAEGSGSHGLVAAGAVAADANSVTLSLALVSELSGLAKRYEQAFQARSLETVGQINAQFDVVVDRILRAWVIVQLEQKRASGAVDGDFVIEVILGDYLDRAPKATGDEDEFDLRYMRWLTGRGQADTDAEAEREFARHWEARKERFSS